MAIAYKDPSTNEPIERERWRWVCYFKDGTTLEQFAVEDGKGGVFHRFAEIDQLKLHEFHMVHDVYKPIIIKLPEGASLVHYYTTSFIQTLSPDGIHTITSKYKGYKAGFKLNGNDHGVLIDHDDTIAVISDFKGANIAQGVN